MLVNKKKILIVDDDVKTVNELVSILENYGFSVLVAHDGAVALKKIEEEIPDIILLDIILPKIDGYSVVKSVRRGNKTKHIPILVFSVKEGMKELFAVEGINDYIVKPVDPEKLLHLIQKRLGAT